MKRAIVNNAVITLMAAVIVCAGSALAQSATKGPGEAFPSKIIRVVVPWPPGGGADTVTRVIVQMMAENLGRSIIVDNRVGASGILGTEYVAKANPDGYTLIMGNTGTHAVNAGVFKKLPYDPVVDFAPISMFASSPFIMVVNPAVAAQSVKEFIALAKARPGQLNYGSGGAGSPPHFAAALFVSRAGVEVVHVPYKGGAAHTPALVAGEIQLTFTNPFEALSLVKAGKLRALAVTSSTRWSAAPDLPTVAEGGVPGYEFVNWWGFLAPKGTPDAVVNLLHGEVVNALRSQDVLDRFGKLGVDVVGSSPREFAELIRRQVTTLKDVAQKASIQLD